MKATVTLSASAGIMLEYNGVKILSDILHHDIVPTFSSVPKHICNEILSPSEFSGAELFLVSHDHPDHFSRPLASEYMRRNRFTTAAAPLHFTEKEIIFSGAKGKFKTYNTQVEFFKTPHEKQKVYADVKHYSYIVTIGDAKFVFLNDTGLEDEYVESVLTKERVDIVFLNFPWVTLFHGRRLLKEYLNAKNAVIYHLPIPYEDDYNYNKATIKALSNLEIDDVQFRIMSTPLDREEFEI